MLALIGEELDNEDEICGVVVSPRKVQDKLAIWTKNADSEQVVMAIGRKLRQVLELSPADKLEYLVRPSTALLCTLCTLPLCCLLSVFCSLLSVCSHATLGMNRGRFVDYSWPPFSFVAYFSCAIPHHDSPPSKFSTFAPQVHADSLHSKSARPRFYC